MAAGVYLHEGYSLEEELQLLEAIYIHELTIEGPRERPSSVSLLLHPSTGDEGDKQYVCLSLLLALPLEYPNVLPSIEIKNPRGLSEAHIESISLNLHELAETRIGSPMLFELIEYAKESLTDNNMPSCACAICLCHFKDSHCFTKTECYHYFHCSCLARYIDHTIKMSKASGDDKQEQVVCPMCRLPISYDLEALKAAPHETTPEEVAVYKPDNKTKRRQKELAALYQRQLQKGGIIDVEQEKNKFLIDITSTPEPSTTEPTSDASSSCDGQGTVEQEETAQDMFQNPGMNSAYEKPAQPHRPGSGRGRNRQYDRGRGGGRKWEERQRNKSRRKEVLNENERDDGMKLGQNYRSKQNIHKKNLGGDKLMQIGQERADNIDAQSSEGNRKNTEEKAGTLNEMFSADSKVITETELDSKDTTADNLDGCHKYTRKVPQRDDGPRGREDFKGPRGNNMGRTPNQKREKGAATKPRKSPGSDTRRHTKK
ncbi:E3 ubiquitin-protein ligase RNF25 isoform X2 [Nematostella vectensis]|uniref:E3 ubiquitin-protein ligase RNF25 isoform X2 n=1 Tax=Nematostella vectensis TaxID=45351 RepID=UPI002077676A|nr:E3 ubiquitin-protein ligase RNF25 isoform X2 [Nematostella vectensis]